MMIAEEQELLDLFTKIHGEMTGDCVAEVVYDDYEPCKVIGVGCVKNGYLAWVATLAELAVDAVIILNRPIRN